MCVPIFNEITDMEVNACLARKKFKSEVQREEFLKSLSSSDYNFDENPSESQKYINDVFNGANNPSEDESILRDGQTEIDPDSALANYLLGNEERDNAKAIFYFKKGMEIERKRLGEEFFRENRGLFGSIPETRLYLECLCGYAESLRLSQRYAESMKIFDQILRLDIRDHFFARNYYMLLLVRLNEIKRFKYYEKKFYNDSIVYLTFTRLLFYYKTTGDSEITNSIFEEAIKRNEYVIPFLISANEVKKWPDISNQQILWAFMYSFIALDTWRDTKGAQNWLRSKVAY